MTIAEHGKKFEKQVNGKKFVRGVTDAVDFFYGKMSEFLRVESGEKLEGRVSKEGKEVLEEYERASKGQEFADRNLLGLEPVDAICKGHRRGEFWVHCAFAAELKTTLALNYAYNNAMIYGRNIFYAMLEMKYTDVRRMLHIIHSSNGKFLSDWRLKDIRDGIATPYTGIDYIKVRDGELNEREFKRFEYVVQDFEASCKGELYVWRPKGESKMAEIQQKAEIFHNKYRCDGVILDYLGLIKPTYQSAEVVDRINRVVMDGRLFSLTFARGMGVAILGLFQMNRQGKARAEKQNGQYDMSAISYANQIEKDADVISYTYLDKILRDEGKFKLGCLKNRQNPMFEPMVGKIFWNSKRMRAIPVEMNALSDQQISNLSRSMYETEKSGPKPLDVLT